MFKCAHQNLFPNTGLDFTAKMYSSTNLKNSSAFTKPYVLRLMVAAVGKLPVVQFSQKSFYHIEVI